MRPWVQAKDRPQARRGQRKALVFRLGSLLSIAVVSGVLLLTLGGASKPYTMITPQSNAADDIQGLYKLIFWLALIVFVGVQFLIFYTALRFRSRRRQEQRPNQVHGNTRLEISWTVIPAIVLLIILVPTIATIYRFAAAADTPGDVEVTVYGKQWWWEVQYPGLGGTNAQTGQPQPLITANEILLPVGKKVRFTLQSNNVIHSFWVPQLSGKMDVIPGRANKIAFTPENVGEYYGECAEFCGVDHAWMRFKVIVVPQAEFDAWVKDWNTPPASVGQAQTPGVSAVPPSFGVCLGCHRINGTNASVAPVGIDAPYIMGPNLTMLACRETIAGGLLTLNEANLRAWLSNPGAIKQDNLMATVIKPGTLKPQQIDELVPYLLSLKPAGGCPPDPGAPATPAATPASGAS